MVTEVTVLRPKERVRQDSEPIAMMYRTMGAQAAEAVVNRAFNELTLTMAELADRVRGDDGDALGRQLRRLQRMSEQLGLVSMGEIASNARQCLDHVDRTAFTAVWARLLRVAESSLATETGRADRSR